MAKKKSLLKISLIVLLVAGVAFVAMALMRGGEAFRWMGKTSKSAFYRVGDAADSLHDAVRGKKSPAETMKEKLKEGADKASDATKKTYKSIKESVSGDDEEKSE